MPTSRMPSQHPDHNPPFSIGDVYAMSRDRKGCREVQKWLGDTSAHGEMKLAIASEFKGRVVEACLHDHANFVLQKTVEELQASATSFIAEEINGSEDSGRLVAKHRKGCRTVQRLIEHGALTPAVAALIDTVLDSVVEFCCHKYGHHVVEAILEHGQEEHKHRVAAAFLGNVLGFAHHPQAGFVVVKVLTSGNDRDRHAVLEGLFAAGPDGLVALTRNSSTQCGAKIFEELERQAWQRTEEALRQRVEELGACKHGRRLIEKFKLKDGEVEQGN